MKTIQEIFNDMNSLMKEFDKAIAETKCDEQTKKEEFEYPLCMQYFNGELVVLFDGLNSGKVLLGDSGVWDIGEYNGKWTEHTNTNCWKQIPYNKERGLYHKQMIYCWNNDYSHLVHIKFYNAIGDCSFGSDGELYGFGYDNYSATMPEHMLTAHKTLKD